MLSLLCPARTSDSVSWLCGGTGAAEPGGLARVGVVVDQVFGHQIAGYVGPALAPDLIEPATVQQFQLGCEALVKIATFPNTTMTAGYVPGPGWVPPAAVHRAVAFITGRADEPVTVDEIAAAAGVSSRALREAFIRYFEVTPLGFLRRARLERAHAELLSAGPASGVTVGAAARRWGWASPSRFAADYRQRFGIPPSHTLRT